MLSSFGMGCEHYEKCTLDLGDDERCNFWLLYEADKSYDKTLYESVKKELFENIKML